MQTTEEQARELLETVLKRCIAINKHDQIIRGSSVAVEKGTEEIISQYLTERAEIARREALEEACKKLCTKCRQGFPVQTDDGIDFWHPFDKDKPDAICLDECSASRIRNLMKEKN